MESSVEISLLLSHGLSASLCSTKHTLKNHEQPHYNAEEIGIYEQAKR